MMMLLSFGLLAVEAQINTKLLSFCPGGYDYWRERGSQTVPDDEWYWGDDWDEFLTNGTSPFPDSNTNEVYPAGFKLYNLAHYNEPPICIRVVGSRDKKVEILMESPIGNANLCIHDAQYNSVGTNDVGNVENCGSGKIYACFTAATTENQELGIYIDCQEGCEDSDVDVWIRIRLSEQSWDDGKNSTSTDLEHWCEKERGTVVDSDEEEPHLYYTYPSDLIPDNPSQFPFHIHQIFGKSAAAQTRPQVWLISLMAAFGLMYILA